MNDDEKVIQQWGEYVDEYNNKMSTARENAKAIYATGTDAQQQQALREISYQEYYLQWMQEQYTTMSETGVVPDTLQYDGKNGYAGFWFDANDSNHKKSAVLLYNPEGATNETFNTNSHSIDIVSMDGFVLSLSITTTASAITLQRYRSGASGSYAGLGFTTLRIGTNSDSATINWTFSDINAQYSGYQAGGWCCGFRFNGGAPTLSDFNNFCRTQSTSGNVNWGMSNMFGNAFTFSVAGGSVDPETPWDFYNDNILPNITPENAAFPDGYQPDTPKPDPDFPELPGEEEHGGDNIEPNDTTGIGGGFGFMTQYALRAADIQELGKKLWAGFDPNDPNVDNYLRNFIYKISTTTGSVNFADIMDFFVSLRFYPCPLGNLSSITAAGNDLFVGAGTEPIVITNIIHTMDSYEGVLNAGTLTLPFWYGDFRDYQTQITLYLPYCGTAELNPVDVMGGTLECFYEIDFCTGGCTGYVWVTTWDGARYCVASLPGQLGADVPMSATNAGRVASRIMGDRITFTENLVSILRHGAGFAGAAASGNVGSAIDRAFSAFITPTISEEKRLNDELGKGAISAPVLGSGGGFATYKNPSTAYVQVRSAFYPDITNYTESVGNPASETVVIGDCTGFCRFVNVDVTSVTADAREQTAIRQALENGVIL